MGQKCVYENSRAADARPIVIPQGRFAFGVTGLAARRWNDLDFRSDERKVWGTRGNVATTMRAMSR